ncbi:helix-turn-helix domain-containing protein [Actinoallomurus iriomotensis]|uniref:Transcriptional regulator n=1 Tax=Actinoallomurus iriomotensis TaxID=478107 RepID=A0A9W6W152_9ACTN|nr:helix-turn-helix transcriptional regulator [Actinoallomurus iriomotensis]GLY85611.1 transcriptional regulator [Actinoallomurus iriomotensis]
MSARMTGREFFGRRLRIAREQQVPKMSRRALGERICLSDSAIAAWESGRNIPDPETLENVERILGTGGLLEDIAENIVTGEKPQEYMGRWAQAEARATLLLRFSFDVFPGLLQIEEYARAILRDDEQVNTRMARQKVMVKENPPVLVALIDESVLHRNVGGPSVMADQLDHLEEMALHDHVIIQVIKLSSAVGAQFSGTFSLAIGESEAGYIDDALSGDVVETPDEVSRLRRMFEMLRKHALSEEASLRLIREVAEAWKAKV